MHTIITLAWFLPFWCGLGLVYGGGFRAAGKEYFHMFHLALYRYEVERKAVMSLAITGFARGMFINSSGSKC